MSGQAWKRWDLPAEDGVDLFKWQENRCASCGYVGGLVRDHCHLTGFVRGLLCSGCNNREAAAFTNAWDGWRTGDNPATALRYAEVYVSSNGMTPLEYDSPLTCYTYAEMREWRASAAEQIKAGTWPGVPPWTDTAKAQLEARWSMTLPPTRLSKELDRIFGVPA